jgi:hypothetical protein
MGLWEWETGRRRKVGRRDTPGVKGRATEGVDERGKGGGVVVM